MPSARSSSIVPLLIAPLLLVAFQDALAGDSFQPQESLRRPVAMALTADDSRLFVANRDSGSVTVVDTKSLKLLGETKIGQRLTDIERIDRKHLLATDEAAHEAIVLAIKGKQLQVAARLPVSPFPQDIEVTPAGDKAYISSLWSRQVSEIDLSDRKSPQVTATIDLPLAPNKQLLVKDGQTLIVADNFAGRLAIVNCETNELIAVRKFFAENIRGLAIDPDSGFLAVSHTMLNEYAHTVRNDVHWGVLMSNDLRWLRLDEVLNPAGDFYHKGHMHPLGEPNMGGADPGELAFFRDGTIVIPIGGVNKVAFGKEGDFGMHRLAVGRTPTTVVACEKFQRAFVANTFDDSISVIDMKEEKVSNTISLGPQRELQLAERGEVLFRDGRLAHDGWMTCNTCHTRGHTNGGQNDNFSDKSFGAPKLVLSLLGAKHTAPYAWNGGTDSLEQQIRKFKEKLKGHRTPGHRHEDGHLDADDGEESAVDEV